MDGLTSIINQKIQLLTKFVGRNILNQPSCAFRSKERPPYVVNLDPACYEVPYPANIDIRDTVNYKEVMKQYGLGPNGGIVTSLNLFATKFDQVRDWFQKQKVQLSEIILVLIKVDACLEKKGKQPQLFLV